MTNQQKINDVIRLLHLRREHETDPVKYARLGEAIWTLQDLKNELPQSVLNDK